MWRSVPQMPVLRTRIRTSLMPTSGSGTSFSRSPSAASAFTSARIRAQATPGSDGGSGHVPRDDLHRLGVRLGRAELDDLRVGGDDGDVAGRGVVRVARLVDLVPVGV